MCFPFSPSVSTRISEEEREDCRAHLVSDSKFSVPNGATEEAAVDRLLPTPGEAVLSVSQGAARERAGQPGSGDSASRVCGGRISE